MAAKPQKRTPGILRAVASCGTKDCIVACVSKVMAAAIKRGDFSHIGLLWGEDGLSYEPKVLPRPTVGRYSKRNVFGYEEVHSGPNPPKLLPGAIWLPNLLLPVVL